MNSKTEIYRLYVEKRTPYAVEAKGLLNDLRTSLALDGLIGLRLLNRYDISGVTKEDLEQAVNTIFAEPPIDKVYWEEFEAIPGDYFFGVEYLPGQFDQRADSAAQCLQIITQKDLPLVKTAKIIVLEGSLTESQLAKIKAYSINPVDSREAKLAKPQVLAMEMPNPEPVEILSGFLDLDCEGLANFHQEQGLAMSLKDLAFVQGYFGDTEKRNPTITEIRVIDTYWSDHCRHTTFLTKLKSVTIAEGDFSTPIKDSYANYLASREFTYQENAQNKPVTLMDIATIAAKELRERGVLDDLDISDEINACSINIQVDVNGVKEPWLLMFKNETHNHPTEIEPFGGAATCLGGAIRDPLSGRTYVYQALRLTGSGDPRKSLTETIPGKLPQRKITKEAARGFSSYGNQIGLATGQVAEIYNDGFIAKRMEIGAVIAAAPKQNVRRSKPERGDLILLIGGRTGRDGCGGATGSSKGLDEKSLVTSGAEVQKGNPPTERKLQRLFRNPAASVLIKKCNDFGAGGVSVAIGELADSLTIDLDAVPKKYQGLDGTELAISESQERMAVVLAPRDLAEFQRLALEENLETAVVARVTDSGRLEMNWQGQKIVDISREFLNTNGVQQEIDVVIDAPDQAHSYFMSLPEYVDEKAPLEEVWLKNLSRLSNAGQKGLVEYFDSTIGGGTVLMPLGGKHQLTPAAGMAAKIPVLEGETRTASLMSYGYISRLAQWSPYHGGVYAVTEAISKIVAMGGSPHQVRLSLQEYFEKLGQDPHKWGKPLAALLGAYEAQMNFSAPAIGGKDSMSGSFKELNVPPTLAAFAVTTVTDASKVISPEFKQAGSHVIYIPMACDIHEMPDFPGLKAAYTRTLQLMRKGSVLAASNIDESGIAGTVSKMCFGNAIGLVFEDEFEHNFLFSPEIGALILELDGSLSQEDIAKHFYDIYFQYLGKTCEKPEILINDQPISLAKCTEAWLKPLAKVFPHEVKPPDQEAPLISYTKGNRITNQTKWAKPRVLIPVFPGTNCEYDTAKAFVKAGGVADICVLRNLTIQQIKESAEGLAQKISQSQIIAFPGGFSAGDEPDGSGKFIASVFKHPLLAEAIQKHLAKDGLILGICNGFQALLKLGLLTYGEIRELREDSPTLTYNTIGRHMSSIVGTKIVSNLSPWFNQCSLDEIYKIAISHGEGRFIATEAELAKLKENGQIATQYVDLEGQPAMSMPDNPNGSLWAIEGITSPDGRILGKMSHSERMTEHTALNIPGVKIQPIFESGIAYFK